MSRTTVALERTVAAIQAIAADTNLSERRRQLLIDRAYAEMLVLVAPRIRYFIRKYGLAGHWEDAEQCCAVAVHRAITDYDPTKAKFTTLVNWQIRGELQSLRFRVMTDQRAPARKVAARTVSLHTAARGADGERLSMEALIPDEDGLARTEAVLSDRLATAAAQTLIDRYIETQRDAGLEAERRRVLPKRQLASQPAAERRAAQERRAASHGIEPEAYAALMERLKHDRDVLERRLFQLDVPHDPEFDTWITKERTRQVMRRAGPALQQLIETDPRFAVMADYRRGRGAGPDRAAA